MEDCVANSGTIDAKAARAAVDFSCVYFWSLWTFDDGFNRWLDSSRDAIVKVFDLASKASKYSSHAPEQVRQYLLASGRMRDDLETVAVSSGNVELWCLLCDTARVPQWDFFRRAMKADQPALRHAALTRLCSLLKTPSDLRIRVCGSDDALALLEDLTMQCDDEAAWAAILELHNNQAERTWGFYCRALDNEHPQVRGRAMEHFVRQLGKAEGLALREHIRGSTFAMSFLESIALASKDRNVWHMICSLHDDNWSFLFRALRSDVASARDVAAECILFWHLDTLGSEDMSGSQEHGSLLVDALRSALRAGGAGDHLYTLLYDLGRNAHVRVPYDTVKQIFEQAKQEGVPLREASEALAAQKVFGPLCREIHVLINEIKNGEYGLRVKEDMENLFTVRSQVIRLSQAATFKWVEEYLQKGDSAG